MAARKSASKRSATKKATNKKAMKTRKSRTPVKKTSKTRKPRAAGKKVTATRKRRTSAKAVVAARKTKPPVLKRAKTVNNETVLERRQLPPDVPPAIAVIDQRITVAEDNLRELTEQAASYSGAADQERVSERIAEQEAKLALLRKQREELSRQGS
jgi:hypothetical protein